MASFKLSPTRIASVIIGIMISILIIYLGFGLMQRIFSRAADTAPRDVVVASVSQNSAKISWSTDQNTQGVIEYGTTPTALNFFAPEAAQTKDHQVELTLLSPTTTYYFQIRVGDKKYDNGGVPWTFATKGAGSDQGGAATLSPTTTAPSPGTSVRPTQSVRINDGNAPTAAPAVCAETDCAKICQSWKANQGCIAFDLTKNGCIGKINLGDCQLSVTVTPSPTP
ncbi:fibronectin type III domain-containing protein [Patescibacteria group bacterium]|nr:fibronectin type III domain-containing protein [Patescibacteria group bacterium]MCL5091977.1 fibronectin type III domain-containing protein [Patescibacteria group bacterium]